MNGDIVNPDIPADRRRIREDLDVMRELAERYIRAELGVPDQADVSRTRNRLEPWFSLLPTDIVDQLRNNQAPATLIGLEGQQVSISLWPDGPIAGLEGMTLRIDGVHNGIVRIALVNPRNSLSLRFLLDFRNGRIHTQLEERGLLGGENPPTEEDVRAYATFVYRVLNNRIVELTIAGREPVDCDIVIPMNIVVPNPDTAIEQAMERFRLEQARNDLAD